MVGVLVVVELLVLLAGGRVGAAGDSDRAGVGAGAGRSGGGE